MCWFDGRVTRNPHLRLQANFDFVFGILFTFLTLAAVVSPADNQPFFSNPYQMIAATALFFCCNVMLLSLLAMHGFLRASAALYWLAWPRLLFPCVGWFFSFFSIRYYRLGIRQVRDRTQAKMQNQPLRER